MSLTDFKINTHSQTKVCKDHGGRRRIKDRRFTPSAPVESEKRTNLRRRSGFDRRIK